VILFRLSIGPERNDEKGHEELHNAFFALAVTRILVRSTDDTAAPIF